MPRILLALTLIAVCVIAIPTADAGEARALNGWFDPGVLEVAVGEEITWTNEDDRVHTVTSSWDEGATFDAELDPGEAFTWTFGEAGEYPIHCVPHVQRDENGNYTGMTMTVHVLEAAAFQGEEENDGDRNAPGPWLPTVMAAVGLAAALSMRGRWRRRW